MFDESFYAYGNLIQPDREFMDITQILRQDFLAPCELMDSGNSKPYVSLAPKGHPIINSLKQQIEL